MIKETIKTFLKECLDHLVEKGEIKQTEEYLEKIKVLNKEINDLEPLKAEIVMVWNLLLSRYKEQL